VTDKAKRTRRDIMVKSELLGSEVHRNNNVTASQASTDMPYSQNAGIMMAAFDMIGTGNSPLNIKRAS
jgi:hypothetical protein